MKPHVDDPLHLALSSFAAAGTELSGRWPLAALERLADGHPAEAPPLQGDVQWSARGEARRAAAGEPQVWLHLRAQARVWRECQRCLQPVALDLSVARAFRFVRDEATAAQFDIDSDEDVLAMPPALDLRELVEDELLLSLPLVPLHDHCPQPLVANAEPAAAPSVADEPHPFAALAALKRGPPGR